MNHTPRVQFDHVWKRFRRGQVHDSLRDLIPALGGRLFRRRRPADEMATGDFWALSDLSFSVEPGEALGIIGPNGAGKSTVLKTLTKIIRPTRGQAEVRGRIGALIEIAAGFHPDLTGRENVALQGAIMGMRQADIKRRFDDIVGFAELEDFIDTPVKRYSSGMNARLGFSIAAHLEPEVLIIDEVLAVGDFRFQQRAFERLRQMIRSSIPVVIVSHQLERVTELCTKALLLNRGAMVQQGSPTECVSAYLNLNVDRTTAGNGSCPVHIEQILLAERDGVVTGERINLTIRGTIAPEGVPPHLDPVDVRIEEPGTGKVIFATSTKRAGVALPESGPFEVRLSLQMNLPPGAYTIETCSFDVLAQQFAANGPSAFVPVRESTPFFGNVNLNAEFKPTTARGVSGSETPIGAVWRS
ncbi:MAG: ABC transporter ATP-binding protein [Gemmatimonadales bacterium]|nr:ABC transporter ATP-binding protein [Gemmatimonadales bacterium]